MAERLFGLLQRADYALTKASVNLFRPFFKVSGIRTQPTESREDRTDLDVYAEALGRAGLTEGIQGL